MSLEPTFGGICLLKALMKWLIGRMTSNPPHDTSSKLWFLLAGIDSLFTLCDYLLAKYLLKERKKGKEGIVKGRKK